MPFQIGFLSDTHIGYSAKVRTHAASGLNMRVRDGFTALDETVTQMLNAEVDLVLHGGDLFHRSWPQIAEVVFVRNELNRLAKAGIPVVVNTGNHDAAAERGKAAATAAVDDPERGIHVVTKPYEPFRVPGVDGLVVHVLSHYGLARAERIVPEPVDGNINVFTGHGVALVPGHEIFACADSPGEQPIGLDLLTDDGFAVKLLGHYHGMGPLPGLDTGSGQAWYAGSALRRGFSDGPGGRGWLLVTIHDDGTVTIEPQYIKQRAQTDLPVIDASGLTGADVHDRIKAHLEALPDEELDDAIIRQVVKNVTATHRAGLNLPGLAPLTGRALKWDAVLQRPEDIVIRVDQDADDNDDQIQQVVAESLTTAGSADLPTVFTSWVPAWFHGAPYADALLKPVVERGEGHLRAVSTVDDIDDGNADLDGAAR